MVKKVFTKLVLAAVVIVIAMMLSASFTPMINSNSTLSSHTATSVNTSPAITSSSSATKTTANWTYPKTTMQEPGYTNGTYKVAATNNVATLNMFTESDEYSMLLLGEIYGSPIGTLPNGSISPWLATSWVEHSNVSSGKSPANMTYDPLTGQYVQYNYTWIVHIRPGVQWTDWNAKDSQATYTYSDYTSFNNSTGATFHHTYNWTSVKMQKYYVQSADFIWSWKMMFDSIDYAGMYQNVVNMKPINNLTVEYYLSGMSATFVTNTLGTPILPYHIWVHHNWATLPGLWNYKANSTNGYNSWGLNYSKTTGFAPGLIGTGPFMMSGYGMPNGAMLANQYWRLYVNPHYWVQYANKSSGLRQFTPKIYSVEFPYYTSESNAVTAEMRGQVDTITGGVGPNFVPTMMTIPNTYIYHKPSSGYGYMQLNSNPSNAPFNITAFRQALNYATNKAYLASVVASGYTILGQPLIPTSDPLWRNASTPMYTYNPQKAESLISNIPGMSNSTGNWYYNGKPVKANIQITSAASNPLGVEGALLIAKWWGQIGIPTTVTQEAFTTLVPNLILYNYNVISLGITGIAGDPTGDFFDFYNGPIGNGSGFYLGPFSAMTYNGTHMTGHQVDSLMNNLTIELNSITNLTKRLQIAKEIQGIAAIQSTMITLGYPVDILPFTNTTFVNISRTNSQPYIGYMFWAFNTVHARSSSVAAITSHLKVNATASTDILYNGQYGNVTVTVTNSNGNAVKGATVFVGSNPSGALLNISSDKGTTNSNGQYKWEFQVLKTQGLIYTPDYTGAVNISAVAYEPNSPSVGAGIGSTFINVLPHSIKITTSSMPILTKDGSPQLYWIKITNANGTPISGFEYTLQSLSGAVIISPHESGQTVTTAVSGSTYGGPPYYASVNNTQNNNDINLISISGKTGSNGTIDIMVSANSTFNFAAAGNIAESYIFLGSMDSGSPVTGAAGYMIPGEMTSSSNPNGFGVQQPVEFPVELSSSTPNVKMTVSTTATDMNYNGSINVTVTVTNATSGKPIAGYLVDFLSENVLGANRGYFVNSTGKDILLNNPNSVFASLYTPGLQIKTNSNGKATVTFYPFLYTYKNASVPVFKQQAYGSNSLVPADMFIITVIGANSTSATPLNYVIVNSAASLYHVSPPATPTSMPIYIYAIIGVVVAAVVIGGVGIGLSRRRKK